MEKPVQITFKDMERSEFLEQLVRERIARLERFHPHILGCRVVVEIPYRSAEGGKPPLGLTVTVQVPGKPSIVAKGSEERREAKNDHTAMVNRVFEAIQRQLDEAAAILHGEVKQHDADGVAGQVVRLFPEQNYGFVEIKGSPDLYFTRNAVVGDFDAITVGKLVHVTVATMEGPMGPQASSVRLLEAHSVP